MALACLPFWGDVCELPCHEDCTYQAIVVVKRVAVWPTEKGLEEVAWELDAAKWRDYNGPENCTCFNKQKLHKALLSLYRNTMFNLCVEEIWAHEDVLDAPLPF